MPTELFQLVMPRYVPLSWPGAVAPAVIAACGWVRGTEGNREMFTVGADAPDAPRTPNVSRLADTVAGPASASEAPAGSVSTGGKPANGPPPLAITLTCRFSPAASIGPKASAGPSTLRSTNDGGVLLSRVSPVSAGS